MAASAFALFSCAKDGESVADYTRVNSGEQKSVKTENFTLSSSTITPRSVEITVTPRNADLTYYVGYARMDQLSTMGKNEKESVPVHFEKDIVDAFSKAAAEESKTIESWLVSRLYSGQQQLPFDKLLEDVDYYFYAVGLQGDAQVVTEFAILPFKGEKMSIDESITFDVEVSTTSRHLIADVTPKRNGVPANDFLWFGGFGSYDKYKRYTPKQWIDSYVQTFDYYINQGISVSAASFSGQKTIINSDRDELIEMEPGKRFILTLYAMDASGAILSKVYTDADVYSKETVGDPLYFKIEPNYVYANKEEADAAGKSQYLVPDLERIQAKITPYKDAAMTQVNNDAIYLIRSCRYSTYNTIDESTGELQITDPVQVGKAYRSNIEGRDYKILDWSYENLQALGAFPHKGQYQYNTTSVDMIMNSSIIPNQMYSIYAFGLNEDGTVLKGAATATVKMSRRPLQGGADTEFKVSWDAMTPTGTTFYVTPASCIGTGLYHSDQYYFDCSTLIRLNQVYMPGETTAFDATHATQEQLNTYYANWWVNVGYNQGRTGNLTLRYKGDGRMVPDTDYSFVGFAIDGYGLILSIPHRTIYHTTKSDFQLDESLLDGIEGKINKSTDASSGSSSCYLSVKGTSDKVEAIYIVELFRETFESDRLWNKCYVNDRAGFCQVVRDYVEYYGINGTYDINVTGNAYYDGNYRCLKDATTGLVKEFKTPNRGYSTGRKAGSYSVAVKGTNGKWAAKVFDSEGKEY